MADPPDASIVDLHRVRGAPMIVDSVEGVAWCVAGSKGPAVALHAGRGLEVGDTLVLEAGARVVIGEVALSGGQRGRAHSFVKADAFAASPGRSDVPRLITQLEQIEEQLAGLGEDPLESEPRPVTSYEKALAAELARTNLQPEVARRLSESASRRLRAVCLFVSNETVFVAVSAPSLSMLREVMVATKMPVKPHTVDDEVIEGLLSTVWGAPLPH